MLGSTLAGASIAAQLGLPYAFAGHFCGADDADARRLAAPVRVAIVNSRTGRRAPVPSVEEALAHELTPEERAIADDFLAGAVLGGPDQVCARLPALAREIEADEIMLSTLVPSLEARRASLERIAAALIARA